MKRVIYLLPTPEDYLSTNSALFCLQKPSYWSNLLLQPGMRYRVHGHLIRSRSAKDPFRARVQYQLVNRLFWSTPISIPLNEVSLGNLFNKTTCLTSLQMLNKGPVHNVVSTIVQILLFDQPFTPFFAQTVSNYLSSSPFILPDAFPPILRLLYLSFNYLSVHLGLTEI